MTAALEYAVRPAVPTSPHGNVIIAKPAGGARERATLTWGAKASLPDVGAATQIACCKEDLTETDRTAETVRIFQGGDSTSDNWVDVSRATKVKLDKKNDNKCNAISSAEQSDSSDTDFTVSGFASDTFSSDSFIKQCKNTWNLKNNTSPATS
jgi:hypothetical protein